MLRVLLSFLLLVFLAGCDTPRPFKPDDKRDAPEVVRPPNQGPAPDATDRPELAIEPPAGMTPANAQRLAADLAIELRRHDVVATTKAVSGIPRLSGQVKTTPLPSGIEIALVWTLHDARGQVVDTVEHSTSGRAEDWERGSDRMFSRFAYRAAPDVALRLGKVPSPPPPEQMSWSVLPGMPPPPGERRPPGGLPVIPTLPPPADPSVVAPPAAKPGDEPPQPQTVPTFAMSRYPKVRVVNVTGAPGDGNATLTRAMRRALGTSQMILADRADPQAFTVTGTVSLAPPEGAKQRISIKWVVTDPGGQVVGDLEQANNIPAGSLNGPWGGLADVIAMAAGDAVVTLIHRARAIASGAQR